MTRRPHDLLPGDRVGSLRVVEEIGRGAFGAVYRAHDEVIGRDVALKVVGGLDLDDKRWALIEREIKVLGRLAHPNIVTLHHIHVTDDGRRMLEMELVEGMDLGERIESSGPLPAHEVRDIVRQLCAALEAAHERGIVHRDVKPANVLLGLDGRVRLADFGLGRDTTEASLSHSAEALIGSPHFLAPELLDGEAASPASDLWSVGVVVYLSLTGKRPFQADSLAALFAQIHAAPVPPLPREVPTGLRRSVAACLARSPTMRVASARQLLALLDQDDPPAQAVAGDALACPLGRDAEVTAIERALALAPSDSMHALALCGDRGVGLTRLLEYGQDLARARARPVLSVRLDPVEGLLRGLGLALARAGHATSGDGHAQLLQALSVWARSGGNGGGALLAVDDLGSGNRDDARFLAAVLQELTDQRVVVLLALHRTDGSVEAPLELPHHPALRAMEVPPLGLAATDALLIQQCSPRRVDASLRCTLVERSAGNPRHLLELLDEAVERNLVEMTPTCVAPTKNWDPEFVPVAVVERVRARLASLSDESRELLELASITGVVVDPRLLSHLAGAPELAVLRELQRLVRQGGWFARESEGIRFAEPVVRDAICNSISAPLRRRLHELAAQSLVAEGANDIGSRVRRAEHWLGAGERIRSMEEAAGAVLLASGGDAIRTLGLAKRFRLLWDTDGSVLPVVLAARLRVVPALLDAGEHSGAIDLLESCRSSVEAMEDARLRGLIELRTANVEQWTQGVGGVDAERLSTARSALRGTDEERQLLSILASVARHHVRVAEAGDYLHELAAEAKRARDEVGLGRAQLLMAGLARLTLRAGDALGLYAEARERFEAAAHHMNACVCSANAALASLALGDHDAALRSARHARLGLERRGATQLAWGASTTEAMVLLASDQPHEAIVLLRSTGAGDAVLDGRYSSSSTAEVLARLATWKRDAALHERALTAWRRAAVTQGDRLVLSVHEYCDNWSGQQPRDRGQQLDIPVLMRERIWPLTLFGCLARLATALSAGAYPIELGEGPWEQQEEFLAGVGERAPELRSLAREAARLISGCGSPRRDAVVASLRREVGPYWAG